jgi:putative sterol carrier protein
LGEITDEIRKAVAVDPGLGKTLKLDLKGDGCIFLDGSIVTNDDQPADCVLLKISGDMTVAMKLPGLLAKARS